MTAVADTREKFEYTLNPKSGAAIWMKPPTDSKGRPLFADLHINVDWAEDLALTLLQAVEEVRKAE